MPAVPSAAVTAAPGPTQVEQAQVVGTGEREGVPCLWLSRDGSVGALPLRGPFALRVRGPRLCIGRWLDGTRAPCPDRAAVGVEAQCASCSGLEHPECVFEPLCRNDAAACLCTTSFRGVEHLVYCAFYGTLAKVGMTQARRVQARLREQGADLYFVVARGLDRAGARALERAVSVLEAIPEHRSHREVLPQLARPVDWDLVERRAGAWADRLSARHPVERPAARIADYPVKQPLPGRPRRVPVHGLHAGTWLGAKGNHLFYSEAPRAGRLDAGAPPVVAIKRADLVGHSLEIL